MYKNSLKAKKRFSGQLVSNKVAENSVALIYLCNYQSGVSWCAPVVFYGANDMEIIMDFLTLRTHYLPKTKINIAWDYFCDRNSFHLNTKNVINGTKRSIYLWLYTYFFINSRRGFKWKLIVEGTNVPK